MYFKGKWALILTAWLSSTAAACSSSSNSKCEDLSGVWNITAHCQASLVNQTATFAQTECGLNVASPVAGQTVTGTVAADGSLTLDVLPDNIQCQGTVSGDTMHLTCQGCAETLQRQR
jgi:hypothetical protein